MSATQVPPVKPVLTYDDYRQLPDDGRRYELMEGALIVAPAPEPYHQRVSGNLFAILHHHARRHKLGEVYSAPIDVVLDYINVVQPDLLFLSTERLRLVTARNIAGAPDLVVEILSPSTAERDRKEKARLYESHGVRHYWIVDPSERTLEAYRLEGGRYVLEARIAGDETFAPSLFPGLVIPLGQIWE